MNHLASLDLVILFFFLGLFASWIKSDLEVPEQVAKFLAVFLLLSLGLKGGHDVRVSQNLTGILPCLVIGLTSCLALPGAIFFFLRDRVLRQFKHLVHLIGLKNRTSQTDFKAAAPGFRKRDAPARRFQMSAHECQT